MSESAFQGGNRAGPRENMALWSVAYGRQTNRNDLAPLLSLRKDTLPTTGDRMHVVGWEFTVADSDPLSVYEVHVAWLESFPNGTYIGSSVELVQPPPGGGLSTSWQWVNTVYSHDFQNNGTWDYGETFFHAYLRSTQRINVQLPPRSWITLLDTANSDYGDPGFQQRHFLAFRLINENGNNAQDANVTVWLRTSGS